MVIEMQRLKKSHSVSSITVLVQTFCYQYCNSEQSQHS